MPTQILTVYVSTLQKLNDQVVLKLIKKSEKTDFKTESNKVTIKYPQ